MALLMTGSNSLKAGVEYSGVVYLANTFKIHNRVKISVNRSPFVVTDPTEKLLLDPSFTYSFEKDTVSTLYRSVNVDGEIVQDHRCITDFALVKNTESAPICNMTLEEDIGSGKGEYAGVAYITNEHNKKVNVTIKFYYDGTSIHQHVVEVFKNTTKAVAVSGKVSTAWTKGKDVHITVEVDQPDQHIYGAINPSVIKTEKQP